jgi:predicted glycosyltransferase
MRVLIDIVHPAHVHFYRHMIAALVGRGDEVMVAARDREVTTDLLDRFGIDYVVVKRPPVGGRLSQGVELARRDWALLRLSRRFRPHVTLSRNPAGMHAARATGSIGVFDTDDGSAVGMHFRLAAPFARVITTPACLREDYGAKHRRYPGYKALAYLHPDVFSPDPSVRSELGLDDDDEPYFLVRFVAMVAAHDRGETGLDEAAKRELIGLLTAHGRVFVSAESGLPASMADLALPTAPHRMHDVIAGARLFAGDSQTMAAEAAVLGVPSFRASTWVRRLDYLDELEDRYGLLESFAPTEAGQLFAAVARELDTPDAERTSRRAAMLADSTNVTAWYLDLLDDLTAR